MLLLRAKCLPLLRLLPRLCLEPKASCVLGNGALGLVQCTVGEFGVDFKRDIVCCVGVGFKKADDLLGDAYQVHLRAVGLDLDRAVEGLGLGWLS